MSALNIGTIKIPINAATKTFAILAKRGAGKSYTAAVMAEEFHKAGIPFVVFDPIDVWWGLRLAADGKSKGLPVVVFGLQHADIKLERDMGAKIARAVVEKNVSCVISTFGMPKVAQRQLIQEFSEELLNINNTPRHVFIEEAHEFVPQRVFGAMGRVFAAVEALVVMGRNKGIGVTLINQRAATINKDVLTQLDTLLAFRNVAPQDRKALREWVEAHAAEGDFGTFMASLPSLPTGTGWIWSPEFMGIFERVQIRKRETFHPDREKLGTDFVMPRLDSYDIEDFIEDFRTVSGESKEDHTPDPIPADQESITEVINRYESQLVETKAEISRLRAILGSVRRLVASEDTSASLDEHFIEGEQRVNVTPQSNRVLDKLGGMARKIYEQLVQHPQGLTRRQIGLMSGYVPTSGSFTNVLSKLKTMGLIRKEGDIYRALFK